MAHHCETCNGKIICPLYANGIMLFEKCECGQILPLSGWKFCERCGKKVSEKNIFSNYRICSRCNYIYRDIANYCINCGQINEYIEELKKL